MDLRSQLLEGMDDKYRNMMEGTAKSPYDLKCTISSLNKYKDNKTAFVGRIKNENQKMKNATKSMKSEAQNRVTAAKNRAAYEARSKKAFKLRAFIALAILAVYGLYLLGATSGSFYSFVMNFWQDCALEWYMPSDGEGLTAFVISVVLLLASWVVYWVIAVKSGDLGGMAGAFFGAFFLGAAPITVVYAIMRLLVWAFSYLFAAILTKVGFCIISAGVVIALYCLSGARLLNKHQNRVFTVLALAVCLVGLRGYQVADEYQQKGIDYSEDYCGDSYETATLIDGENFYNVYLHKEGKNTAEKSYHYFKYTATKTESCVISALGPFGGRADIEVWGPEAYSDVDTGRVLLADSDITGEVTVTFYEGHTYYLAVTGRMENYDDIRYADFVLLFDLES